MKSITLCALAFACTLPCTAQAIELSGALRTTPEWRTANESGVLAPAAARLRADDDLVTTDVELRGIAGPLAGVATLRHVAAEDFSPDAAAILNELHASIDAMNWYLTVGKKIVSWDVGYAFRPLDVIQQEDRRRLTSTTLEGIPVLMAERFGENSAVSIVVANPGESADAWRRDEPAVATRAYWRSGGADVHAVVRYGARTHWWSGAAAAFVASESLELHASSLYAEKLERVVPIDGPGGIAMYELQAGDGGWQALVGASWTGRSKVSVLIELWRDERAWSKDQWQAWRTTTRHVREAIGAPALREGAVALAAGALGVTSLHRDNALVRLAWLGDSFSPSADVLYTPVDGGAIATARLEWRGSRTSIEAGWRHCFGPSRSLVRQLPVSEIAFLSLSVSF